MSIAVKSEAPKVFNPSANTPIERDVVETCPMCGQKTTKKARVMNNSMNEYINKSGRVVVLNESADKIILGEDKVEYVRIGNDGKGVVPFFSSSAPSTSTTTKS